MKQQDARDALGGLPIGVMLGARFGEESLLLRLSAQLEAAMPWANRHPPISLWDGNR